jgi:prenyl protein peptidase
MSISRITAVLWCITQTGIFVSSLYVLVPKAVRELPRNEPIHIKYRFRALVVAVVVCGTGTWTLSSSQGLNIFRSSLDGISFENTIDPLISYVALFFGPIVQLFMIEESQVNLFHGFWADMRNLVVAPIVEELVFRSFMGASMLAASPAFSRNVVVFGTPAMFGLAHAHHAIHRIRHEGASIANAVLIASFQTLYTTLFGALMMDCLLKTQNILTVILIHAWCNFMGFPDVEALIEERKNNIWKPLVLALCYCIGIYIFIHREYGF